MDNCKNCNTKVDGNFCSNCGSPRFPKRIDRQYVVDEISGVLNFERGIFYTIKELFIRPGDTAKRFINGERKRIVKPIIFLIICSLFYTVGQQFLSYEASYIQYDMEDKNETPIMVEIFDWFSRNYGYANILMAIFIAVWIKIFFRKYKSNYYEVYILLCFIMGNSVLIYTLLGIIESIIDYRILQLGIFIVLIYCSWGIGQFFDRKKKMNYLKGFLSYLFGIITSLIILFTIGFGLDNLLI